MAAVHRTAHQPPSSLPPTIARNSSHPRLSNRRAVVPAIFRRLFRSVSSRLSFPSRHRSRVSFHRSFHFPSALCRPLPPPSGHLCCSLAAQNDATGNDIRLVCPTPLLQAARPSLSPPLPPIPDASLRYPARYSVFTIIIVVRFLSDSVLLCRSTLDAFPRGSSLSVPRLPRPSR